MAFRSYTATDPLFQRLGRHDPKEKHVALWWSGSGLRFHAACAELIAEITCTPGEHVPWMGVLLDGAIIARFPLMSGTHRYPLLEGMDPAFPHEISLMRDTQPTFDEAQPPRLEALICDGKLTAPQERSCLIEFLGDSLTVGEGTVGPHSAMEWRMSYLSHMHAFSSLVSESMHADKRLIALSGWGVWRGWDGDATHRIGLIYDALCAPTPGGEMTCPNLPGAAFVVINLGTNDSNAIKSVEDLQAALQEIQDCAISLMEKVRSRNPEADIIWAYGLCGHDLEAPLHSAVEKHRAVDPHVHYLSLSDCNGDVGSRSHPSFDAHRIAAREIEDCLTALASKEVSMS